MLWLATACGSHTQANPTTARRSLAASRERASFSQRALLVLVGPASTAAHSTQSMLFIAVKTSSMRFYSGATPTDVYTQKQADSTEAASKTHTLWEGGAELLTHRCPRLLSPVTVLPMLVEQQEGASLPSSRISNCAYFSLVLSGEPFSGDKCPHFDSVISSSKI